MNKSLQEAIELRRSKGQSDAEIVDYLLKRSDRKEEHLTYYKNRASELKSALIQAQFESGRRVKVTVDNIIRTCWGNYLYHKNTRYVYDGKLKAWVKDPSKNSLLQHNIKHLPGKFHVEVILPDEEMPRKWEGVAVGNLFGKRLLAVEKDGMWINSDDTFIITKKEKNNA
ncbi:hypothetical protein [Salmonella phage SSE121]|nr:hypothetical protein ACQ19_gp106 [Salmonella phage SSE121]AFU63747.1 hypothetical protein [Salmonella phage SSE121]